MASSTDWKLANDFVDCMRCPNFGAVVEVVEEVEEVEVVVVWAVVPLAVWFSSSSSSSSSSQSTSTAVMFKPANS